MAWSTEFEELMPDGVTISALSGLSTDGYGTEVYGTGSTYQARIVRKQHPVRTLEGVEDTATTMVWVNSTTTFAPTSRFALSDGSTPENLMALEAYPDQDGLHHVRLSFG